MDPRTARDEMQDDVDSLELLNSLRAEVFHDSNEALGLALGQPPEQIEAWLNGDEEIDEDAEMKIRGIAEERL